jgi:hypothetical protein
MYLRQLRQGRPSRTMSSSLVVKAMKKGPVLMFNHCPSSAPCAAQGKPATAGRGGLSETMIRAQPISQHLDSA